MMGKITTKNKQIKQIIFIVRYGPSIYIISANLQWCVCICDVWVCMCGCVQACMWLHACRSLVMVCLSLCGLQRKGIFLVNRCIVDVHTTGFLYLSLIPSTGVSPTLPLLLCICVSAAAFSVASSHYTCMSSDNDLSLSPVQGVV